MMILMISILSFMFLLSVAFMWEQILNKNLIPPEKRPAYMVSTPMEWAKVFGGLSLGLAPVPGWFIAGWAGVITCFLVYPVAAYGVAAIAHKLLWKDS